MKTGRYSLKELLTHNEIDQIIIPEIQRDYVWKESNVRKLVDDIKRSFKKKESHSLEIKVNDTLETSDAINQFLTLEYERLKYHQKLGFIYAYHDRDYAGKFFLIDGQQRITTLFLILLYLYKALDRQEDFKLSYFNQGILKVDYKVREQSHDFLKLMVECELAGKDFKESDKFYGTEYLKDTTINNLIQNYDHIISQLSDFTDKSGVLDFLENFVEVNYFDTHLSEQGEQLYIYMNSRGEQLSHQEIIRAELMQNINEPIKKVELEWEKWQNFFWQHRGGNENADIGFEEFLKWAAIIHMALHEDVQLENFADPEKEFTQKQLKENYIKDSYKRGALIRSQKAAINKYQKEYLDFSFLNSLFEALSWIYLVDSIYIPIDKKWLNTKDSISDYVVLLPLLQYQLQNEWDSQIDQVKATERVAMFLKNVTYFEGVSKNPDTATLDALVLVSYLKGDNKDLVNLYGNEDISKTILTKAEQQKLSIFKDSSIESSYWESFIWDITLDDKFVKFMLGDISVLLECLEKEELNNTTVNKFNVLDEYLAVLKEVVFENKDNDKLRHLVLSKFDYSIECGTGKGLPKSSFIANGNTWNVLREWKTTFKKPQFVDLLQWIKEENDKNINSLLIEAKHDFEFNDWRQNFIYTPALLEYCGNKKILRNEDLRILLLEKTNYSVSISKEIQCALLEESFKENSMWVHKNNCCVLDFEYKNDEFYFDKKVFALDIVYNPDSLKWTFSFFHREKEIEEVFNLTTIKDWEVEKERLVYKDSLIPNYNTNKTLLENNEETVKSINRLFDEIKKLFDFNV